MIRILIADDHAVVRRGLKEIIAEQPGMAVLGEAQNGRQVLELLRRQSWDILVLDLGLPDQSGLEVLAEVKRRQPKLPVLVLSMQPEDQFGVRVLKAGAAGYLNKNSAPEELVSAIRKVHGGGRYVSPALAETLASSLRPGAAAVSHEALTDREFQVLCLIASGKTPTQIAGQLALSVKTVSTYRARVLQKMRLHSSAELMRYAIHLGLVE